MFKCLKFLKKVFSLPKNVLKMLKWKGFYKKSPSSLILKYIKNKIKEKNSLENLINKRNFLLLKIKHLFFRFLIKE